MKNAYFKKSVTRVFAGCIAAALGLGCMPGASAFGQETEEIQIVSDTEEDLIFGEDTITESDGREDLLQTEETVSPAVMEDEEDQTDLFPDGIDLSDVSEAETEAEETEIFADSLPEAEYAVEEDLTASAETEYQEEMEMLAEETEEELLIASSDSEESVDAVLYCLNEAYSDVLSIPEGYPQSYRINLGGMANPTFRFGEYSPIVQVTSDGIVTPKPMIWYKSGSGFWVSTYIKGAETRSEYRTGTSTIKVYDNGSYRFSVKVEVKNYSGVEYENRLKEAETSIDTTGGELSTLTNITRYVAENYSYDARYQSAENMMIFGGGDCWASTNLIVKIGSDLGLNIRGRNANYDPGAGNGHRNAIAKIGGTYYIAEAGYTGNKPRRYSVKEEPCGFARIGGRIYQYDGDDPVVDIPSEIDGTKITALGYSQNMGGIFARGNVKVTTVNIPSTVTSIYDTTFFAATKLTAINVDPGNSVYKSIDGVLYSKDGTTLYSVPIGKTSVSIPRGVTTIGGGGLFECLGLKQIEIPDTVTSLGKMALAYLKNCTVIIPSSVTSFGENLLCGGTVTVLAEQGSAAETYCADNNYTYETYTVGKDGSRNINHSWGDGVRTSEPDCDHSGVMTYTCTVCGEKRTESIRALGHSMTEHTEVEATCSKPGNIRFWECSRCGRMYTDKEASDEVTQTETVLEKIPHTWGNEYVIDRSETDKKEGSKSIHCTVCGASKPGSSVAIPKLKTDEGKKGAVSQTGSQQTKTTIRKKVTGIKIKASKRRATVSWKKLSAKALRKYKITGIELQYSTDRSFRNDVKIHHLGKTKKSFKFKGKKGTRYYVRLRYCGKNGCSAWSKIKKIKIRKK